ncbi:MAG: hypothetical protein ACW987_12935 [Candidatus Thorarchaeota archaeon]
MTTGKLLIVVLLCAAVFLASGCDKQSSPDGVLTSGQKLEVSQQENEEAVLAALWLSGALYAPDELYQELLFGYSEVRSQFGDSIPTLNQIYFSPLWVWYGFVVEFTESAAQEIRAGEYTDLDSLNTLFGIAEIDTLWFRYEIYRAYFLQWDNLYHMKRVCEIYEQVESVVSATTNNTSTYKDNAYPYPCITGDGMSYLFRYGWGDCPSGCIYHQYWYFKVIGNTVEYIGTYDTSVDPEPPDWFAQASAVINYYNGDIATGIDD